MKWGNQRANLYWEAHLKSGHIPPDQCVISPPTHFSNFITHLYLLIRTAKWSLSFDPNTSPAVGPWTAPHPRTPLSSSQAPVFLLLQHQPPCLPRPQRLHRLDFPRRPFLPHVPPRHSRQPIELEPASPPVNPNHISSYPLSIPVIRALRELLNLLQH